MATLARDPRDVITPEAFRVADHLIGVPLARPARRLGAILIDLLLVAILVALKSALAFVLAVVGAVLVFRLSRSKQGAGRYRRFYRHGLGCFGALLTFILLIVALSEIQDLIGLGGDDEDDVETGATLTTDSGTVAIEGLGVIASAAILRDGFALRDATTPGQRDTLADRIVETLLDAGLTPEQVRESFGDLQEDEVLNEAGVVALEAAVETVTAQRENRPPRSADQIRATDSIAEADSAAAYVAAAIAGDTLTAADSARVAASDSIRALSAQLDSTRADLAEEQARRADVEEQMDQGAVRWVMSSVTDELGLGLGWLGLYFTAFTVLGGGQTPGKRVFRLRVIRLDGRPIGWWTALQRFGGYSASVFTGMLGFAEMFWDDNRQALQDKLVATVVIQEPKKGEQAPDALPLDVIADRIEVEQESQLELPVSAEHLLFAERTPTPFTDDAQSRDDNERLASAETELPPPGNDPTEPPSGTR